MTGTKPVERYKALCVVIYTGTGHIRSRLARDKQPRSVVPSQVWGNPVLTHGVVINWDGLAELWHCGGHHARWPSWMSLWLCPLTPSRAHGCHGTPMGRAALPLCTPTAAHPSKGPGVATSSFTASFSLPLAPRRPPERRDGVYLAPLPGRRAQLSLIAWRLPWRWQARRDAVPRGA